METPTIRPSRTRHWVIVFAVTLAVITYIDRVSISSSSDLISRDLNLTEAELGIVFAAFAWAYALFEMPGGWLGDRIGPRKVLMRVVIWWSVFTALTGKAWNLSSLVVTRFLFGAGEAGCFPNLTKIFSTWLPHRERARAQGILWMSARWGGAATPLLVGWVLGFMSWQNMFLMFGAIGVVWAICFYVWFRDNPLTHPQVNAGERELLAEAAENASGHGKVPWKTFASYSSCWLLWLQYFCLSYGWYFYITWLPKYLKSGRGIDVKATAYLAGLPLFMGGIGCLVGGVILARLAKTIPMGKARKILAVTGFVGAAAFSVISLQIHAPLAAMLILGLASFCNDLTMPGTWSAAMDIGGRNAGTFSGSINMMGNFAGGIAPMVVGFIVGATNNWTVTFYITGAVYLLGGACWFFIDPVTSLDEVEKRRLARATA